MKKFSTLFAIVFFAVCPLKVYSAGAISGVIGAIGDAIGDAAVSATLWEIHGINIVELITTAKKTAETAKNTIDQLKKMEEAAERAIKNIRSVVDVRSVGDFMNWYNRQLYLEREVEYRYDKASVNIGKNTYKLHEIDEIPGAMMNTFRDARDGDFTEEQKRDMLISLGLAPSNYTYLKTWQDRSNKIAKRILTYSDIYSDEQQDAYDRNKNIMDKYDDSSDNLDINEITKEAHITTMNIEMAIREQTRLMNERNEYDLSRDRIMDTPPTPPRRSYFWDENPFGSITEGHGENNYERWP